MTELADYGYAMLGFWTDACKYRHLVMTVGVGAPKRNPEVRPIRMKAFRVKTLDKTPHGQLSGGKVSTNPTFTIEKD